MLKSTVPDFDSVEMMQAQLLFLRFMFDVPEGRVIADYQKVVDLGCNGLIEVCRGHLAKIGQPLDAKAYDLYNFYQGTILALEGVIAFANNYADEAERQAKACKSAERAAELFRIAEICRKVPAEPAETFQEAVQSWWFAHLCIFIELNGRGMSPGRLDQYLYRPYLASKAAGGVTDEEVLEYFELMRIKCTELTRAHATFTESYLGGSIYQNLTLGGVDRYGRPAENELSRLVLKPASRAHLAAHAVRALARRHVQGVQGRRGRMHQGRQRLSGALHDKMGTERFMKVTGATLEDARDWAPCGCVDMQICGKRMPMYAVNPTNNMKVLELVMHNGVNPVTGDRIVKTSIDFDTATYEEIVEEYDRVLRYVVRREEEYWNTIMAVHNALGLVHPLLKRASGRLPGERRRRLRRRLPLQRRGLRHLRRLRERGQQPGVHQEERVRGEGASRWPSSARPSTPTSKATTTSARHALTPRNTATTTTTWTTSSWTSTTAGRTPPPKWRTGWAASGRRARSR